MFVKYCGFTRIEDVQFAAGLPLSAAGFIFHRPSKRCISPEKAAELGSVLKKRGIKTVGVFVRQTAQEIREMSEKAELDMLQLYDHCVAQQLTSFLPILYAYRVREESSPDEIIVPPAPHFLLLDAFHPAEYGGTGERFDWKFLEHFASLERTIIAGGINHSNVKDLLSYCYPYGIDVSSGIEKEPGVKDHQKMGALINNIQNEHG